MSYAEESWPRLEPVGFASPEASESGDGVSEPVVEVTPSVAAAATPSDGGAKSVEQPRQRAERWQRILSKSSSKVWLTSPGYTLGVTTTRGASHFSPRAASASPAVMGYHFQERNGFVSGAFLAGLFYMCGVMGAGAVAAPPTVTETWTTTDASGNRWRVTETRAVGPGNAAGGQAMLEASGEGATSLLSHRMQNFELSIYTRDWMGRGLGETMGFRTNFLVAFPFREYFAFETGYGIGRSITLLEDERLLVESRYSGMPLRLLIPFGPFMGQVGMDMNFRKMFDLLWDESPPRVREDGSFSFLPVEQLRPWPVYASVHALVWRLHVSVGVESSRLLRGDFGTHASLGVRF